MTHSLRSGLLGAGTAVVAAPLGMAAGARQGPTLRAATNKAVSGGIGFGSTYALTGNSDQAWQAAATGAATAGVMSLATQQSGPAWGRRKAYDPGRGAASSSRSVLAATMLGLANAKLPFRGTGASVSGMLLELVPGLPASEMSSPQLDLRCRVRRRRSSRTRRRRPRKPRRRQRPAVDAVDACRWHWRAGHRRGGGQ